MKKWVVDHLSDGNEGEECNFSYVVGYDENLSIIGSVY